ncbi:RYamide receptor [Parasteatoda tepidariorum]|uniref:RYamide receptor n=1 Tax=Parasteatoda tepidariorum TaxID=114398 RepID=UPI001C7183FA|nr:RYamide receptor [Parasteatoda tepidariorum]
MSRNSSNSTLMDPDELFSSLEALGPEMQLFLVVLYSCTALAALGGNAAAIAVLMSGKRRSIRLFLVNLALSDVTMAVFSIPFTYTDFVLGRWIFLPEFCPVVQFVQHVSVSVSVYTLTVVGLDRYYAIIYPLSGRWTKVRGRMIIFLIWLCSIALSSFQLVHGKAERFLVGGQEVYDCNEIWDELDGKVYTSVVFFLTFLVPMLILSYTYGSIGVRMWAHTTPGNADASRDRQQLVAKMKVVKMMATIVILFALCWLPIHIFGLMVYFVPDLVMPIRDEDFPGFAAAFLSCHWLSMANSFVNPLVYCFMSDNFRTDLRNLLHCQRGRERTEHHASTLLTGSSTLKHPIVALRVLKQDDDIIVRRSCCKEKNNRPSKKTATPD